MKCCDDEQVCGTDGVTYESICHLRSQSANAQVDYRGACVDEDDSRPWEICRNIRNNRHPQQCENTQESCPRRVLSKDACCPVCGTFYYYYYIQHGVLGSVCVCVCVCVCIRVCVYVCAHASVHM